MRQYTFARQKLWEALYILVSDGPLKERLGGAHAELSNLQLHHFPENLRDEFQGLMIEFGKRVVHYAVRPSRVNAQRPVSTKMAHTVLGLYTKLRGGI